MDFIVFILSMSALIYGAELLIVQSEKLALHYNISPFIIGATLVAIGTSLPEMAVSISASLKGSADIAVSNVIGSTIFNIALVLGTLFLISKNINPKRDFFAKDSAWALFPILVFILMAIDGKLNSLDGILFIIMMFGFIYFLIQSNQLEEVDDDIAKEKFIWYKVLLLTLLGFLFTIFGAKFTIDSATNIALSLGVSQWLIGLFLIALGTSLPELVITIKAALKNSADLAIGNIIGSNVANFTMVLGASSIVNTLNVNLEKNFFDVIAALILSLLLVFITANKLYNKSAGIVLFVILILVIQNSYTELF